MNQHGSNSSSGPPNFHLSSLETPSTVNQSSAASNVEAANTLIRGVSDVVHSRALLEVFLSRNMTEPNHVRIGRNQGSLNSLMEQHQQQQRYLSRKQQGSALGIINKADNQLTTSSKKAGEVACVPCRARGMPADHNFENAHFLIGENRKHGVELVCSYPACRNGGVKFCYCTHCRIPVAKRNFRVRHHHFDAEQAQTISDVSGSLQTQETTTTPPPSSVLQMKLGSTDSKSPHLAASILQHQASNPDSLDILAGWPFAGQHDVTPDNTQSASLEHGTAKVPCRARGMPPGHNFETAHFIIPPNIKHGDELICSYPACRKAGVKFCFCTHCRIPVAKRNFRIRHNHCNFVPPAVFAGQQHEAQIHRTSMLSTQVVPCIAHGEKDMKNAEAVETGSPNLGLDPSNHTRKRPADSHPAAVAVTASDCSIESATSEYRMTAWDSLLDERPPRDSPEKMSAWLMSVLAVSDLDVPVDTENMIPEAIYNLQDGEQQMNQVISIASVLHLEKKDSVKRQTKFHKPEDGR